MDEAILYLETFKALREYQALGPMTEEEWSRMKELIPGCPMEGQAFDELNMLYPLKIPQKAIVHRLSEIDEVFSCGCRYDHSKFVNVIGGMDLLETYSSHLGEFLFVVGRIKAREKGKRTYHNIRPRGWILVSSRRNPTGERKRAIAIEEKKRKER